MCINVRALGGSEMDVDRQSGYREPVNVRWFVGLEMNTRNSRNLRALRGCGGVGVCGVCNKLFVFRGFSMLSIRTTGMPRSTTCFALLSLIQKH